MTGGELLAVGGGFVLAVATWIFLFRLDRRDIWPRTWIAAAVVSAYAIAASAALGEASTLLGPVTVQEVGLGVVAGGAWLLATHIGVRVLGRIVPGFLDELSALYHLADDDTAARIVGPLIAMAIAEELLFRGLIQGTAGFAVAVVAYGAVQLVEKKWILVLAALLGGAVWGALFAWRDGLVAPIVAHALWTVTLTLVWPLPTRALSTRGALTGPQTFTES